MHILPAVILGRNELATSTSDFSSGTNRYAMNITLGIDAPVPMIGATVHVNDAGLLHVQALSEKVKIEESGVRNFIASAGSVRWSDVSGIVEREFSEEVKQGVFKLNGKMDTKVVRFDASVTEEEFGIKWRGFDEQVKGAELARKAATAERYPTISFNGDYGDIGVNPQHSHGTGDATGTLEVPVLEEGKIRGDQISAQTQLEQKRAQSSNLRGQIAADVRDAILDIQAAQRQVQVARSNVDLATEELSEAQQRFVAGIADNLAVSQAQQSLAQANDQYTSSLYQHNVAKLSLARALGVAQTGYRAYVGGR